MKLGLLVFLQTNLILLTIFGLCRGVKKENPDGGVILWYYHCFKGHRCKSSVFLTHHIPYTERDHCLKSGGNHHRVHGHAERSICYVLQVKIPTDRSTENPGRTTNKSNGHTATLIHLEKTYKLHSLVKYDEKIKEKHYIAISLSQPTIICVYFGKRPDKQRLRVLVYYGTAARGYVTIIVYKRGRIMKQQELRFPELELEFIWFEWRKRMLSIGRGEVPTETTSFQYASESVKDMVPIHIKLILRSKLFAVLV